MEDTVAAIRLRTRYHDPYEEWKKETLREAFVCFNLYIQLISLYIETDDS
jgi:hypothetical protein